MKIKKMKEIQEKHRDVLLYLERVLVDMDESNIRKLPSWVDGDFVESFYFTSHKIAINLIRNQQIYDRESMDYFDSSGEYIYIKKDYINDYFNGEKKRHLRILLKPEE